MKSLESLWTWIKNKFGRITTSIGAILMTIDVLDLNPARPWITELFNEKVADHLIAGTAAFFFVLSWIRHQVVANQHPSAPALPDPQPGTVVKP